MQVIDRRFEISTILLSEKLLVAPLARKMVRTPADPEYPLSPSLPNYAGAFAEPIALRVRARSSARVF